MHAVPTRLVLNIRRVVDRCYDFMECRVCWLGLAGGTFAQRQDCIKPTVGFGAAPKFLPLQICNQLP